jgi:hypothetical protein
VSLFILVTAAMLAADGRQADAGRDMNWRDALVIGVARAHPSPGISRSTAFHRAGLWRGLEGAGGALWLSWARPPFGAGCCGSSWLLGESSGQFDVSILSPARGCSRERLRHLSACTTCSADAILPSIALAGTFSPRGAVRCRS